MMAALPEWNGAVEQVQRKSTLVRSIVLVLDGTERTRPAIPVAEALTRLYGATIHVAYVGEEQLNAQETARRLGIEPEPSHVTILPQSRGNAVELIMTLARDLPDALTVISTDLGQRAEKDRFGSLTEAIFSARPRRAVVVSAYRGEKPWNLRHILLAHDGTPASHVATCPAADLAQRAGAEVIALHVAARGEQRPEEPGSISAPLYVDQPQHEWPTWAHEFMNRILAAGTPPSSVHFKLTLTGGQTGSEVAQVARDRGVDLVVMAWHGHWDHESSATRVVIRSSGCPVLLVYSAAE
jgi:nucleotide-binding universal stress UspA family protein